MASGRNPLDYGPVVHPAQSGRRRAYAAVSAALLLSGGLAVGLGWSGTSGPPATVTVVAAAVDASVTRTDGSVERARPGLRLRAGDIVRTPATGSARLRTGGRVVWLVAQSSLQVRGPGREELRTGGVVVDARRGAALQVVAGEMTVAVPRASVTRVERGFTVRVGALEGPARVLSASGRSAGLAPLHQLFASGPALAARAGTPLQLLDDAAERGTGLSVVADDLALRAWATGSGSAGVRAAAAALRYAGTAPACSGGQGSVADPALPVALARVAAGGTFGDRYHRAVCYRLEGGSWGVVAHLLGTRAAPVLAELRALGGTVLAAGPGGAPAPHAEEPAPPADAPAPTNAGRPADPAPPARAPDQPGDPQQPGDPAPPGDQGQPDELVTVVQRTVDQLVPHLSVDLLPDGAG